MDNAVSLLEWLTYPRSMEEKRNLLYGMDLTLKNLHKDLKYVPSFDFQKTMVNWTNATQVVFHNVGQASLQEIADWKQYDRNLFTTFAIGLYLDWPYANVQGRLPDFNTLYQSFDRYVYLLPEMDIPYYEAVLLQGQNLYFSDYVRNLKIQQASEGVTAQSGKRLVYHTDHQVGVEKDSYEEFPQDFSKAAFANTVFLGFLFMSVALMVIGIVIQMMS